jgi:hypothetical protein
VCSTLIIVNIGSSSSLIADLGSKEILEDTKVVNFELHDEWLFLMKAKAGKTRDGSGLVEHIEVAEGKLLSNRLSYLEEGLLFLLVAVVVS